jgi:hypothetical protein
MSRLWRRVASVDPAAALSRNDELEVEKRSDTIAIDQSLFRPFCREEPQ